MTYFLVMLIWAIPLLSHSEALPLAPAVDTFLKTHKSQHVFMNNVLYNHYYSSTGLWPTAVVFLPGMGEPAIKYYDITTDVSVPATFYLWDHIGQGLSFHYVPLERTKVHIDDYEIYIQSLTQFLESLRKTHSQVFVIAHSMGGHIALRVIYNRPDLIDKLVLSAPMIEINSTWVPVHFISWIANFLPSHYYPPFYFLFKKNSESGNYTTTSKEKIAVYKKTYARFPEIHRSGASLGWIRASQNSIRKLYDSHLEKIKTPILLLQAEEEYLVSNPAQDALCKRIPTCTLKVISKSRHELLFETDEPRQKSLSLINEFLAPI